VLPAFSSLASKTPEAYAYLSESIDAWPDQRTLAAKIEKAGYEKVTFRNLSFGIVAIHVGFKPKASK
jgi:demethylmenaquinone methyltransferase/2-methoxy-6-polyprenyl-1,4-benzoquinol methylase